jgi:MFS family permease
MQTPAAVVTPADSGAARTQGAAWALFLLAVTIMSASAMRGVFSPLQEIIARDLRFTDFQMSLIQGVGASLPVAILSIPIGRMTDRGQRARLLIGLSALWTLGTIGTVIAADFWQMFLARTFAGVGAMCSLTVAISMAADLSAPAHRGRSLLGLSLGNMVGAAAAFALGGALLGHFADAPALLPGLAPWRSVHLAFGLASALITLLLFALREPVRREMASASTDLRAALRELWARRTLLAPLFLGQVTVVMADAAASIWAAPVLTRSFGLEPQQFAGWMGLVLLGSGVAGAVIGAVSADLGQKSRWKGGISSAP